MTSERARWLRCARVRARSCETLHPDRDAPPCSEVAPCRALLDARWPAELDRTSDQGLPDQRVTEFVLDRGALLSGGPGSRAIGASEEQIDVLGAHGWDQALLEAW